MCQGSGYPLLTNHLGKSCKPPLPEEYNIRIDLEDIHTVDKFPSSCVEVHIMKLQLQTHP